MNAKTLEAIRKHGEQLLAIFPNATERDPVALCKKLRRVENVAHKLAEDCCNSLSMESLEYDKRHNAVVARAARILGLSHIPKQGGGAQLTVNMDPRGYALKIDSEEMRIHGYKLHRDFGGYGIIAPDLTSEGR